VAPPAVPLDEVHARVRRPPAPKGGAAPGASPPPRPGPGVGPCGAGRRQPVLDRPAARAAGAADGRGAGGVGGPVRPGPPGS
jgi:hypothetical protein